MATGRGCGAGSSCRRRRGDALSAALRLALESLAGAVVDGADGGLGLCWGGVVAMQDRGLHAQAAAGAVVVVLSVLVSLYWAALTILVLYDLMGRTDRR